MTEAARLEALAAFHFHTLHCLIRDCPVCRRYFQILLTPTPSGGGKL
jgi:hypothetical protein